MLEVWINEALLYMKRMHHVIDMIYVCFHKCKYEFYIICTLSVYAAKGSVLVVGGIFVT